MARLTPPPARILIFSYVKDGKVYVNIKLQNAQSGNVSLVNIIGSVINKVKVTGNGVYDLGSPKIFGIYIVNFVTNSGAVHAKKIFVPE